MDETTSQALSPGGFDPARLYMDTWATAAKEGIGTAYADDDGGLRSRVWFTLARGALTEVYYPDIATPSSRLVQLAVTDRDTFFDLEMTDTSQSLMLPEKDALVYRQTNEALSGRYSIEKTYCTDPDRHALVLQVTIRTHVGTIGDYDFAWLLYPSIGGATAGNQGTVIDAANATYALVYTEGEALATGASVPLQVCHLRANQLPASQADWAQLWEHTSGESDVADVHVQVARICFDEQTRTAQSASFSYVLAFAQTSAEARDTLQETLAQPFEQVYTRYCAGWQGFIKRLHLPETAAGVSETQYYVAAMTLKAHEDKLHLGAVAASLSIPWGDSIVARDPGTGGYHLIWSRDLYQVASSLASVGDETLAIRALRYLQDVQQRDNGSFPQNTWPDGSPYWSGLQLDQTAFPILLAYMIDKGEMFWTMVKRAADFLVRHGAHSQQERWEENSGYSPSTLAAVIAGLTAAGVIAKQQGDFGAAAVYLAKADEWALHVQTWTAAGDGALSSRPYYLRVSDTTDPNDGHFVEIKNGGGWHRKTEIVDAGFLELVRLGIKPADDPVIVSSVDVIDEHIFWQGPEGHPFWYRYNCDGYGEASDGSPYHGSGQGHPWPLLSGERGEYELALAGSARRHRPQRLFGVSELLATMAASANCGYMIAEQVWDGEAIPERHLQPGAGTGSATPLAWAMAQYLRLAEGLRQGSVVDTPAAVLERYVTDPPAQGPEVRLDLPDGLVMLAVAKWQIVLSGSTTPGATVAILTHGRYFHAQADAAGRFACPLRLGLAGDNAVQIIGYDQERALSRHTITIAYRPRQIYAVRNDSPVVTGQVKYHYPTHPDFKPGDFSLAAVTIYADEETVYFEVELGHLDNPWGGPSGISKQIIDIYLQNPNESATGQLWTKDLGARFRDDAVWHKLIRVSGNWHGEAHVYNSDWTYAGPITVAPNYEARTVSVAVPKDVLGDSPGKGWGLMVVVAGEAGGKARPVRSQATEWTFGGASDEHHSYILDYLVSPELMVEGSGFVSNEELPMNRLTGVED
ncbi:MAG: glycoside hydrolase family 15 protein [Firmicutes bacterium]|nr:glycoside hydrolase family 15 protein [Bacillota bacterium]